MTVAPISGTTTMEVTHRLAGSAPRCGRTCNVQVIRTGRATLFGRGAGVALGFGMVVVLDVIDCAYSLSAAALTVSVH